MKTFKILFYSSLTSLIFAMTVSFITTGSLRTERLQNKDSRGFAVIELFTSEGCSSCPPADRLIEELEQNDTTGNLLIMAYHVDYWDHQGWKDRFSDHRFSVRQSEYAKRLKLPTIYTPQIIINGLTEHIGSNRASVVAEINNQLKRNAPPSLKLRYIIHQNRLTVTHNLQTEGSSDLQLAVVQRKAESQVRAGENSGKHLSHVQVVRSLQTSPVVAGKVAVLDLPQDFSNNGWELIGLIQHQRTGVITNVAKVRL